MKIRITQIIIALFLPSTFIQAKVVEEQIAQICSNDRACMNSNVNALNSCRTKRCQTSLKVQISYKALASQIGEFCKGQSSSCQSDYKKKIKNGCKANLSCLDRQYKKLTKFAKEANAKKVADHPPRPGESTEYSMSNAAQEAIASRPTYVPTDESKLPPMIDVKPGSGQLAGLSRINAELREGLRKGKHDLRTMPYSEYVAKNTQDHQKYAEHIASQKGLGLRNIPKEVELLKQELTNACTKSQACGSVSEKISQCLNSNDERSQRDCLQGKLFDASEEKYVLSSTFSGAKRGKIYSEGEYVYLMLGSNDVYIFQKDGLKFVQTAHFDKEIVHFHPTPRGAYVFMTDTPPYKWDLYPKDVSRPLFYSYIDIAHLKSSKPALIEVNDWRDNYAVKSVKTSHTKNGDLYLAYQFGYDMEFFEFMNPIIPFRHTALLKLSGSNVSKRKTLPLPFTRDFVWDISVGKNDQLEMIIQKVPYNAPTEVEVAKCRELGILNSCSAGASWKQDGDQTMNIYALYFDKGFTLKNTVPIVEGIKARIRFGAFDETSAYQLNEGILFASQYIENEERAQYGNENSSLLFKRGKASNGGTSFNQAIRVSGDFINGIVSRQGQIIRTQDTPKNKMEVPKEVSYKFYENLKLVKEFSGSIPCPGNPETKAALGDLQLIDGKLYSYLGCAETGFIKYYLIKN